MRILALTCASVLLATPSTSQAPGVVEDPLAFLEPLHGDWAPHPDWPTLAEKPELHDLVPLSLRPSANGRVLWMREGLPVDGSLPTEGIITWDPRTESAVFLASQGTDQLLFRGFWEPVSPGIVRRVYDVTHPSGLVQRWRETFTLEEKDVLEWSTEIEKDGVFRPFGPSGFRAVRIGAPAESEPQLSEPLSLFEPLIGTWQRTAVGDGTTEERRLLIEVAGPGTWVRYAQLVRRHEVWRIEESALIGFDASHGTLVSLGFTATGAVHRSTWRSHRSGDLVQQARARDGETVETTRWHVPGDGASILVTTEPAGLPEGGAPASVITWRRVMAR